MSHNYNNVSWASVCWRDVAALLDFLCDVKKLLTAAAEAASDAL